jgi:hypothetical protein
MPSTESVFRALQHGRRRRALRCVAAHQSLTLPDLAELVLERETGDQLPALAPERIRDVYFSLYHTHVPVLCEADLCWYDQPDDRVGIAADATDSLTDAKATIDALLVA